MRKAEWTLVLGSLALGTILLFVGLILFYWAMWNILHGYGSRPAGLEDIFNAIGVVLIIGGIFVTSYPGKKLEGKYLAIISFTHLIVAPSAIYLVFSILDPYLVYLFMHPIILSNIPLDIGFLLGYFMERRSKISIKMK